jgi:hypothetical protein
MTLSILFLNGNSLFFFLDSDSPFNCLNASIKILLPYMRKFLRKKKVGKNKFYNEQKQVKNCVSKYVLKIMELNVYPSTQSKLKFLYVVFLLNESFSKTFCKTNNTYE